MISAIAAAQLKTFLISLLHNQTYRWQMGPHLHSGALREKLGIRPSRNFYRVEEI
jgi:hypothetical protein